MWGERTLFVVGFAVALVGLTAIGGCGGGQTRGHPLDRSWDDEDGKELASFAMSWKVVRPPPVVEAAIGVVDHQTLVGRALPDGPRWRYEHTLESRPIVTGNVVVGIGGGELFALDVRHGEELWTRPAYGRLRGASDDGATTLVSLASLSTERSIVLAVSHEGHVKRQIYEKVTIGAPTVLDSFAFLPYGDKRVLIFDLLEGSEAARIIASTPASQSFMVGRDLYFGEGDEALRFDAHVADARRGEGTTVTLPVRDLPGAPLWLQAGSVEVPVAATRHDSVRYYARPLIDGGEARIERYALSYFQIAMGLTAPDGLTVWAHVANAAFLGGAATDDALVLCDAAGDVRWLDLTTGAVRMRRSLDEAVIACAVQSERGPPAKAPDNPTPIALQLAEAVATDHDEAVPIQLVLLDDINQLSTPEATRALIRLATPGLHDNDARRVLQRRAAELLGQRTSGLDALVDALYAGSVELPLRPMARALVAASHTAGARALAWRLQDPRWSSRDLLIIARALEVLSRAGERALLAVFFSRVRCTQPALDEAVIAVARTLVRLGAADLVQKVASEACDNDAMRRRLGATAETERGRP